LDELTNHDVTTVPLELFDFAFCRRLNKKAPELNKEFKEYIEDLQQLAIKENWGTPQGHQKYPVLHNYIWHTYMRIAEEYNDAVTPEERAKKIPMRDGFACFNTGLFTEEFERIFALFEQNRVPDRQPWYFLGFVPESDRQLSRFSPLPERANYFEDPGSLIFDYRLEIRPNKRHILVDNKDRLPQEYQAPDKYAWLVQHFEGAVNNAQRRLSENFKLAVPQYYRGRIQLLVPLYLTGNRQPDLALAIERDGDVYQARTCLTIDMAYNNARLIVKPQSDWLQPA
jgi:hypothetical protein